ncbi:MAG: hypothetical protein U9Q68_09305 [Euryarchaeota archaeon]|nr:hypothetical protein [Euryarchaeota archaeon]
MPDKIFKMRIAAVNPFAYLRARQKPGAHAIYRSSTIPDTVATPISDPAITICR